MVPELDDLKNEESPSRLKVAAVLQSYVRDFFDNNSTRAAKDLGITKQRLNSYTTQTNFPRPEIIDRIREKWKIDLLNIDSKSQPNEGCAKDGIGDGIGRQMSLFDEPFKLVNGGVEIVLERKGAGVAVGITISPNLKRA